MRVNWRVAVAVAVLASASPGFSNSADCGEEPKEFPSAGLLPKEDIGALRFLEEHSQYDGRGVVVAILDTGVDPGVAGLQVTSDGRPKIIDMVDGTGSGDVDTREVRKPRGDTLEGLSGRQLKLSKAWLKREREFHVGLKRGFDFFPRDLIDRLKKERREKFEAEQCTAEEQLRRQIAAWETEHPEPSAAEQSAQADLKVRLEQLTDAAKEFEDPGPLYDCVVFHDGDCWRTAVDTNEDGDLTDEKLLTDYRAEREYATFGGGAELNFTVNVYDEGGRLSLVTQHDAHGTHVAGIVAGYFPKEPEFNGIAPGAQLVSVKIGDTRLGGMETMSGISRGLKTVLDNHCDLVNLSYGMATSTPDRGRLVELFEDLVDRHGVVFVAAAGNDGPALSSVVAPGGTSSALIGVAAYVSGQMAAAEDTVRHPLKPMAYTWTSRGPTFDGDLGVNLLAPGGAISAVPTWTLSHHLPMKGTSMASPNACGAVALLISAMKADDQDYSPNSLLRALSNTARNIERADAFTQGAGLIQVDRAYEYLVKYADAAGERLRFQIELSGRDQGRGVYLRELYETRRSADYMVKIEPRFPHAVDNAAKIDFEIKLVLESTASWVRTGDAVLLTSKGRTIQVNVDPRRLEPGVHFAEVLGYDADDRDRGPLVRVPVTVITCHNLAARADEGADSSEDPAESKDKKEPEGTSSPFRVPESGLYKTAFELVSGRAERRFLAVPYGATWAELKLRRVDHGEPKKFLVHGLQRVPDQPFARTDSKHHVKLNAGEQMTYTLAVDDGYTLELCVAQDWSSYGTTKLEYDLKFRGLMCEDREIQLPGNRVPVRVEIGSPLHRETIVPKAALTRRRSLVFPARDEIRPLDPNRDRQPDGKQRYELLLRYEFQVESAASITLRFPQTDEPLYDSPFGGGVWLLFDAHKRRVAVGGVTSTASLKLEKGQYTVRLPLRHDDPAVLQELHRAVMYVEQSLEKSVPIRVFPAKASAVAGGQELTEKSLQAGEQVALYFCGPDSADIPAEVKPGEWLLGTVSFSESQRSGEGPRADRCRLAWVAPATGTRPGDTGTKAPAEKTLPLLADEVRDYEVAQLRKLGTEKDARLFRGLAEQLQAKYPDHLPLLAMLLHREDAPEQRLERLDQIVQAADAIVDRIDQDQLAQYFGVKPDPENPDAAEHARDMLDRRELLADALYRKGLALADRELPEVLQQHPLADREAHEELFEATYAQLQKWADMTEGRYALLPAHRQWRQERYGSALALLNKFLAAAEPDQRYFEQRVQLYKLLGWDHLAAAEEKWLVLRFPKDFEPF